MIHMPAKKAKAKSADTKQQTVPAMTVVKKMRDYRDDPFFVKKLEDTMNFLGKAGLPDRSKFNIRKNG